MLRRLNIINLDNMAFAAPLPKGCFVLKTCQRTLIIDSSPFSQSLQSYTTAPMALSGPEAYSYLLETICGLKSKLCGECEVRGQFKQAYQQFITNPDRDKKVQLILEKLFKDSKEIRTKYLNQIQKNSYAGITRKILTQKEADTDVLILGSGKLAEDLIVNLRKKYKISLSARNNDRANELKEKFKIELISWKEHKEYLRFNTIINTIGANRVLFEHRFFTHWLEEKKCFIDLGTPSILPTEINLKNSLFRLNDIFTWSQTYRASNQEALSESLSAIKSLVRKRSDYFFQKEQLNG